MTRLKSLKGFTLIELIVVVIIIGVLAAIAAVAYNQFVAQARKTAAVANAKQVVTAVAAYGQSNDLTAEEAIAEDKDTLGVQGNITISAVSDMTAQGGTAKSVLVATDSKHDCIVDVTKDIPQLVMASCRLPVIARLRDARRSCRRKD